MFKRTRICEGDEKGNSCNMFCPVDKTIILPIGKTAMKILSKFLEGKGDLDGTDFIHVYNYSKNKIECPRVGLAMMYHPDWDKERLVTDGIDKYIAAVIEYNQKRLDSLG